MKGDLDDIIIKSLFTWKRFIESSKTFHDKSHYKTKFNGLYNYAKSYQYDIPKVLEDYHIEVNKLE